MLKTIGTMFVSLIGTQVIFAPHPASAQGVFTNAFPPDEFTARRAAQLARYAAIDLI